MTTSKPISAATNLQKKTDRYLMAIVVILLFTCILWPIFYVLSNQQLAEINISNQEMESIHVSDQKLVNLDNLIDTNTDIIEDMDAYFPNESDIISTFEIIETLVKEFDSAAVVNIPSEIPTKKDDQLQIPLKISLTTTVESLTRLLREFEQLPLFLEVDTINLTHSDTNAVEISLGISLYVDEPFIQP